ncbi:MAG: hypothetical protein WBM02_03960 [bacterium]
MNLAHLPPDKLDLHKAYFRADFAGDLSKICHHQHRSLFDSILDPLTAIKAPSMQKPILISGFRHYQIAKTNHQSRLSVILLSPDQVFDTMERSAMTLLSKSERPDWEKAGWIIALKKLSPVIHTPHEAAGVLKRASDAFQTPVEELVGFFPALKDYKNLTAIMTAAALPMTFLKRCQNWGIDVTKTAILAHYHSRERYIATVLACLVLKLSVTNIRRFERLVRDLALRENTDVFSILSKLQLDVKKNVKGDWLTYWEKKRSPQRALVDEAIEKTTRILEKKPIINLSIPDDYEGDYFDVTFRISSISDLEKIPDIFSKQADAWKQLLNLIQKGLNETVQKNSSG